MRASAGPIPYAQTDFMLGSLHSLFGLLQGIVYAWKSLSLDSHPV